jgi:hypothetical protein
MRTSKVLVLLTAVAVACGMTAAKAAKRPGDLPVTTSLTDYDAVNQAYTIQSDAGGAYQNGVGGVVSILMGNGFNNITWGDWRLNLLANPTLRTVGISFCDPAHGTACSINAVQPGDPGYTAPANPPWWGTQWQPVRAQATCSALNRNMYTMKAGDRFPCVGIVELPKVNNVSYELHMGYVNVLDPKPETQELQVTCSSSGTDGNCNNWFLDPIPVVNADGTTSAGQTRARLTKRVTAQGKGKDVVTNEGDFYLTFHINITRP